MIFLKKILKTDIKNGKLTSCYTEKVTQRIIIKTLGNFFEKQRMKL